MPTISQFFGIIIQMFWNGHASQISAALQQPEEKLIMTVHRLFVCVLAPTLLASCASAPSAEQQARLTEEARGIVGQAVKSLGGELKTAMADGGPANAISVCKEKAPLIAASLSAQHGVKLRRVSEKNRNPKAVPDAWEAKVLKDFEARLARGEQPATLEYAEVVGDGRSKSFRYMKGLVTQEICMSCHGTRETITDAVKTKLSTEYPNDQATGYLPNQLRGAASLTKPL